MIHAYDEVYLGNAREVMGRMLDFAVYDLEWDLTEFFDAFIVSGAAEDFGAGDYRMMAGMSGVELAYEVLERIGKQVTRKKVRYTADRSPEYWTGWALAYYQWETSMRFKEIVRRIPIEDIRALYSPYHEMDIRQFTDKMDELYLAAKPDTNLKIMRQRVGLTQRQLSEMSGIPLRTLQQYEQRQKNINKSQAEYLIRLAKVLSCEAEDLIEHVSGRLSTAVSGTI